MDLKDVKKGLTVLSSIIVLGFGLTACGGGGGSSTLASTSTASAVPDADKISISPSNSTQVTTAAVDAIGGGFAFKNGVSVAKMAKLGSSLSETSSQTAFKKSMQFAQTFKALSVTNSQACPDGGSIDVTGDVNSGTVTYNQCQYGTGIINGSVNLSGNADGTSGTATYNNFSLSENGEIIVFFESTSYTYQYDTNYNLQNMSITMNGYAITLGERTDFKNYTFTLTNDASQNVTFTISGFVKTACLGAWIEVVTNEDIKIGQSATCPNAGKLTIGGNASSLVITFNTDLSSDVSINGAAPEHYSNCNDLDTGICAL
ncbi:MAG TPA: hypothetical protein ENK39_02550 [Epsilonproteobacteria bacterium]|nr:hypothetical protein [Campylobacterota bacterium]